MPATGALIGTPASISESDEPQTDAIDVEPLERSTSDTRRSAYGNSSTVGTTGSSARSASRPWPISRRFGLPTRPVSPLAYGRHVVVVHVALLVVGAEGVEQLVHPRHAERGDVEHLRLAPLEEPRAVRGRR